MMNGTYFNKGTLQIKYKIKKHQNKNNKTSIILNFKGGWNGRKVIIKRRNMEKGYLSGV